MPESVFHDFFSSVDECYRATYEEGLVRLSHAMAEAARREQGWVGRVRSGLVALLAFFDDEPAWSRLLVLEPSVEGASTFQCRQRLTEVLLRLLDRDDADTNVPVDSQAESDAADKAHEMPLPARTDELVAGGVYSVIRTSMLEDERGKLVELAPSLMAFIVAPHLGQAAAQAELEGRPCSVGDRSEIEARLSRARTMSRAAELPIRATHRTTLVLRAIAQAPYSNNREIAQAAGLVDEGQTSKLLARLARKGLIENIGIGAARGEPNAWVLTASGRRAVELLTETLDAGVQRRRGARSRGIA